MLYSKYFKRVFDLIVSILLVVSLSWALILIVLLYLITFQYPVFFRQVRIGKNRKLFSLIKFRTLKNIEAPLDKRRFLLGDLLRSTSLDELPQLLNVIKGEMSLVGPRPLPASYLPLFSKEQMVRHAVLPGVTGWAQVNGRHGIPWKEKFQLDLYYIKHICFTLDLKIFFKTIFLILSFSKDVSLQEEQFKGDQK